MTDKAINDGMIGIYNFDLTPVTGDIIKDAKNKHVKAYKLALMAMRKEALMPTSRLDALVHSKSIKDLKNNWTAKNPSVDLTKRHLVDENSNNIRAYYIPWSNNKSWTIELGDDADFCFTPTLDGCTIAFEGGAKPRLTHANFQAVTSNGMAVHQPTIDADVQRIHGTAAIRTLKKDQYGTEAEKLQGKQFQVTVVGVRDPKTGEWDFFYQRKISEVASGTNGSYYKHLFADRMVRI